MIPNFQARSFWKAIGEAQMLRGRSLIGLSCLTFGIGSPSQQEPDFNAVQGLLASCKSPQDSMACEDCALYVIGAFEVMVDIPNSAVMAVCPSHTTNGAVLQILINWAEQHPLDWTKRKSLGVEQAMLHEFPCRLSR